LLAQLQHPHILPVFDYGEADGYPYIIMPFVRSGTLTELLKKGRLPFSEVRRIMIQIGNALGYAHARGMIHRDIKPSNVLIDEQGNCLLSDFGLARMADASAKLTSSGAIMGTPAYMSPEQGTGSIVDRRSDIYSLGIILYEMVTSRVPYVAETPIAVVFKHIQDPLPSARNFNPALPESIELVLLKALAKSPEDRFQTAEDFVRAIRLAIPERDIEDTASASTASATIPVFFEAANNAAIQSTPNEKGMASRASAGRIAPEAKPSRFPALAFAGIGTVALILITILVVMSRSNTNNEPAPIAVTAVPTQTNTSAPTASPIPLPTSTAAVKIASGTSFKDDFVDQLADGWTWLAEDPEKWSLSAVEGSLQIIAADASFDGPALPPNILVREPPSGDFEITTSLRFAPTSDYQFAGLIIFQDQGNVLQFGRAFCDLADLCSGDGVYFDSFENGSIAENSYKTAFHGSVTYLRLRRIGNTYTGYYSEDGENWLTLGEHTQEFSQVRVGLMAAQAPQPIPATFDFFTMNALSP
jgi:serine/threonine protein kinase